MKLILDTNIFINVFLSPNRSSPSYRVLELCLKNQAQPQIGAALMAEYLDVSSREALLIKSRYSKEEIDQMFGILHFTAKRVYTF